MVSAILLVILGIGILVVGGECLVRGAASLAKALGVSSLVIGLTIVAGGTSAPELVVSVMAAAKGNPAICAGNIVGSNIFNILLILGAAAVVCPLNTTASFVRREMPIMIGVTLLCSALALDGRISSLDGVILVMAFLAYNAVAIKIARSDAAVLVPQFDAIPTAARNRSIGLSVGLALLGLIGLGGGSELFLRGSIAIARHFGMSDVMIGLTLVAFGTSLPELVTSAVAAIRKQPDICLGNVVGSNVFNLAAILGLCALFQPVPIDPRLLQVHIPVMVTTSILLWVMLATGQTLSRREGALLLTAFTCYFIWTIYDQA